MYRTEAATAFSLPLLTEKEHTTITYRENVSYGRSGQCKFCAAQQQTDRSCTKKTRRRICICGRACTCVFHARTARDVSLHRTHDLLVLFASASFSSSPRVASRAPMAAVLVLPEEEDRRDAISHLMAANTTVVRSLHAQNTHNWAIPFRNGVKCLESQTQTGHSRHKISYLRPHPIRPGSSPASRPPAPASGSGKIALAQTSRLLVQVGLRFSRCH